MTVHSPTVRDIKTRGTASDNGILTYTQTLVISYETPRIPAKHTWFISVSIIGFDELGMYLFIPQYMDPSCACDVETCVRIISPQRDLPLSPAQNRQAKNPAKRHTH